jgi:hypothetical protein
MASPAGHQPPIEPLLDEHDIERMRLAKLGTIRKWRQEGRGPRFIKVEGAVRYRLNDVREYLNSRPSGGRAITKPVGHAESSLTASTPAAEATRQ